MNDSIYADAQASKDNHEGNQPDYLKEDYSSRYFETTQETLIGLYAKRDPVTGKPVEGINDIIRRVAKAVAVAELKYALSEQELVNITLDQALVHPKVKHWAKVFAEHIGKQKFWPNTPANINADAAISLKVLQYWTYGKLANLPEEEIWLKSEELRQAQAKGNISHLSAHEQKMAQLSHELHGKGCLAACGVAYVEDSLEGIQETARIEALAAKAAMGMGLNTSTLRPWSAIIANGAAASGPDRFYEKTIAKAVEAVAQGGRRGGALIELRNSNHPDILFFIEKKRLMPPPKMAQAYKEIKAQEKQMPDETETAYKARLAHLAEKHFGDLYAQYLDRQNYLKNTNITMLAMPGFMQAVQENSFYAAVFAGKSWSGALYDPRRPILDEGTGLPKINKLTKEPLFEEYSVDLSVFPEALAAANKLAEASGAAIEITKQSVKVKGHFYAPDVIMRIVEGMCNSGEPGLAFYETVNASNANDHVYDLNTCNPCGEQFLPAGPGRDGRFYMGNCNLSSLHAAHPDFWKTRGHHKNMGTALRSNEGKELDGNPEYDIEAMQAAVHIQQRFMDNVTDVSWYPLPQQNMTARLERRNGGGFAGIAEYLSRRGIEFGSNLGLQAVEELFCAYIEAAFQASTDLAQERGVYPLWQDSRFARQGHQVRNTSTTNNAPTGTLAQAMQTSWGVDPHNGIVFSRQVRSCKVDFVAPGFREMMSLYGAWPESAQEQKILLDKIRQNHKSCRGIAAVPQPVQIAFPIRSEIEAQTYIRHLAAIHKAAGHHKETFNSVSNTCAIPLNAHRQVIYKAVILAWQLGVKDITFYPDGSRISQPIEVIAPTNTNLCDNCSSQDWQKIDECWMCQSCGYSKCS